MEIQRRYKPGLFNCYYFFKFNLESLRHLPGSQYRACLIVSPPRRMRELKYLYTSCPQPLVEGCSWGGITPGDFQPAK